MSNMVSYFELVNHFAIIPSILQLFLVQVRSLVRLGVHFAKISNSCLIMWPLLVLSILVEFTLYPTK